MQLPVAHLRSRAVPALLGFVLICSVSVGSIAIWAVYVNTQRMSEQSGRLLGHSMANMLSILLSWEAFTGTELKLVVSRMTLPEDIVGVEVVNTAGRHLVQSYNRRGIPTGGDDMSQALESGRQITRTLDGDLNLLVVSTPIHQRMRLQGGVRLFLLRGEAQFRWPFIMWVLALLDIAALTVLALLLVWRSGLAPGALELFSSGPKVGEAPSGPKVGEAPSGEAVAHAPPPTRTSRGFGLVLLVYLASRVFVLGATWIGQEHVAPGQVEEQRQIGAPPGLLDAGESWDGGWYLNIVKEGYSREPVNVDGALVQRNYNFFPAYPMLVRGLFLPLSGRSLYYSGLLVSNLCALGALFLLYLYCRGRFGEEVARNSVVLAAFFPASYIFSSFFSEALFLLMLLALFLLAERRRWLLAGLAGAVLTATRINGIMVMIPAVLLFLRQRESWRAMPTRADLAPLAGLALMPLGLLAYMGYLWIHLGDPLAFLHAAEAFGQKWGFYLHRVVTDILDGNAYQAFFAAYLLASLAVIHLLLLRRQYLLYVTSLVLILPSLVSGADTAPFECFPRYLLVVFPVFIAPALLLRGRPTAFAIVLAILAGLNGCLAIVWGARIPLSF